MCFDFEQHQNCKYFCQNAWQMSEGKYECLLNPNHLFFLEEIPENCVKGFKAFHYEEPKEPVKDYLHKCKIYEFRKR